MISLGPDLELINFSESDEELGRMMNNLKFAKRRYLERMDQKYRVGEEQ